MVIFCTFYSANMVHNTIYHHNVKVISMVLFLKMFLSLFKVLNELSLYRVGISLPP